MTIREQLEEREYDYLSEYAAGAGNQKDVKRKSRNVIFVLFFSVTEIGSYIVKRFGV